MRQILTAGHYDFWRGTYGDSLFGTAVIGLTEGQLTFQAGERIGRLEHWQNDVFRISWADKVELRLSAMIIEASTVFLSIWRSPLWRLGTAIRSIQQPLSLE